MNYIIEIENLVKKYDAFTLGELNLKIPKGEIVGLIGENGAGKSTLIKILTGLYKADSGKIIFQGEERKFTTVLSAQKAGISTIIRN